MISNDKDSVNTEAISASNSSLLLLQYLNKMFGENFRPNVDRYGTHKNFYNFTQEV